MTSKIFKGFISILSGFILTAVTALSVSAQYPPSVKAILAGGKEQTLTGVIRVQKEFGRVPAGPGKSQAAINPCGQFYVAVLDPDNGNRPILVSDGLVLGRGMKFFTPASTQWQYQPISAFMP